jgi:hypothetical protein
MIVQNVNILSADQKTGLMDYFLARKFQATSAEGSEWVLKHPYCNERSAMELVSPGDMRRAAKLQRAEIISIGWQSQTDTTTVTLPSYVLGAPC